MSHKKHQIFFCRVLKNQTNYNCNNIIIYTWTVIMIDFTDNTDLLEELPLSLYIDYVSHLHDITVYHNQ